MRIYDLIQKKATERVCMRILLLGLNFSPELVGIGKYTGDLASHLSRQGFDLRVVTTPPYYPEWKVKVGYSGWRYQIESVGDMLVVRCPLWAPRRPSNLSRIPHLLSFALSSLPVMLAQIMWKPDITFCVIPTLLSAPLAWFAARLSGAKCWLHIQDFELDAALNLGILSGKNLILSFARVFERFILSHFDRVSTISDNMLTLAVQKGAAKDKTFLFPNWVDTCQIFPMQDANPMRAELGIDDCKKVILYHGNLGRKQGLEILIQAAARLQAHPEILFLICGEGAARSELEQKAMGMKNIRFIDLQPRDKLNCLVNLADVHVLPQRAGVADLVMPSKLTTMLASGKPVLACASPGTQLWKVVDQVGRVVPPEDAYALSEAIIHSLDDPDACKQLAKLARIYTCRFLDKEVILSRFEHELRKLGS